MSKFFDPDPAPPTGIAWGRPSSNMSRPPTATASGGPSLLPPVADRPARLALTGNTGDIVLQLDTGHRWELIDATAPELDSSWQDLGAVQYLVYDGAGEAQNAGNWTITGGTKSAVGDLLFTTNAPLVTGIGFNGITNGGIFSLSSFTSLTSMNGAGTGTEVFTIDFSQCTTITDIDWTDLGIISLDVSLLTLNTLGLGNFASLTTITGLSSQSSLTQLSLPGCTLLTSIPFTSLTALETVDCTGSGITAADLSACSGLTSANFNLCADLTSITVTGLAALTNLDLGGTGISALSLTGVANLQSLNTPLTGISTLNLTPCQSTIQSFTSNDCASLTTIDVGTADVLNDCEFPACGVGVSSINAALVALAASAALGNINGTFDSSGQTPAAPPSGAGAAAVTTLEGFGWSVTTD